MAASSSSESSSSAARTESVMLSGRLAPGIGMTVGPCASSHASATCCGETSCVSAAARPRRRRRVASDLPMPPSGDQGRNAIPRSRAGVDLALGERRGVAERELVLDRDDLGDPERLLELLDGAVGQADPAHLALVLELLECADRLGVGHVRVGAVVLVEVDAVGVERLQRGLAGRADVLGPAVELPRAAGADVARLGGDETPSRRPFSALAISRSLWPTSSSSMA